MWWPMRRDDIENNIENDTKVKEYNEVNCNKKKIHEFKSVFQSKDIVTFTFNFS